MPNYSLRLYRDTLAAKTVGPLLPARPRVVLGTEGVITARSQGQLATLGTMSAWHGTGPCTLTGGTAGGTALRWELTPHDAKDEGTLLLAAPITLDSAERYLIRCDRVSFPVGGIAYTHTHRGPGIRCLLTGSIRIQTNGAEHPIAPGQAWFEAGPDPVLALASESETTSFARVMVLPRELLGQSSIRYVLAEDQDKPKRQSYQLFADEPFELG